MTVKIDWTKKALEKRDNLVAADAKLLNYFSAIYQSLKQGEIPIQNAGTVEISVEFTIYKLVLNVETDRIAKVKYVEIINVL